MENPKLLSEYGRAMESTKKYKEALHAYQKSGDFDAQVRVLIDHLNAAPEALNLVRQHRMVSCADIAAKFCQSQGDHRGCIEFLLLAKKPKSAMDIARQHELLDVLAQFLGDDASAEDFQFIAQHYERQQNSLQAAEFYLKAHMYEKSVRLFMTSGDSGIERAIEVCGIVGKDEVTHLLRQFLLGESRESDGVPKEAKWMYKLHMRLGNYDRAGKSAAIIADELLSKAGTGQGYYTQSRDVLRDAQMDLAANGRPPPPEVSSRLRLLHSYSIVRGLMAREEHVNAARMLVRCSKEASKIFAPANQVYLIFFLTVRQCKMAKMQNSAHSWATQLWQQPEYKAQLSEEQRKNVETILRKRDQTEAEAASSMSPCPSCGENVLDDLLECPSCNVSMPFCIVTGYHITKGDTTVCPHCRFPARQKAWASALKHDNSCPMCNREVRLDDLALLKDVHTLLHLQPKA